MDYWILVAGFFLIAVVYSSVGFGGGSSYLALLSLPVFGLAPDILRPTALLCNIVVVAGSSWLFVTRYKISIKTWLPYVLLSVPFAFMGGWWPLTDLVFYLILASSLILSSIILWMGNPFHEDDELSEGPSWAKLGLGGGIGFLSGLVSIGGGIFLSPVLHHLRWERGGVIAGIASIFILVNSLAGLAGQYFSGAESLEPGFIIPILAAVIVGGQIGSRLGSMRFNATLIRKITAAIVLIAALTILQSRFDIIS